ncbi:DNA transposase THAP9 [Orchesella cincta]|uniref:DNA transposase THAP9 n=1 Tax=Orchesella cincta TaxID=48709 RepID=A0A1D2NCY9_ORCCI|nr:DNA transposase THAP9 [Orchesella cincta]
MTTTEDRVGSEEWEESRSGVNSPEMMTTEVDPSMTLGLSGELPFDMAEWTAEELAAYNALRSKRKKCCIGGCTPRSLPIARSYHQLPVRNQEVWARWVEVIRWSRNDPEWTPNGDAAPLVCSRHFPDSEFISYEASSRVRLSHTAIPVNYVDPPEGTTMDARFSNPLPLPPCIANTKPKLKKIKLEEHQAVSDDSFRRMQVQRNGGSRSQSLDDSSTSHNGDEYGYDIEEVQDYDAMDEEDQLAEENFYMTPQVLYKPSISFQQQSNKNKALPNRPRLSAPPALTSFQGQRNIKRNSSSKPPGLIRANFVEVNKLAQKPNLSRLGQQGDLVGGPTKTIVKNNASVNPVVSRGGSHPTKHKLGLEKCRLIVQTLDNQLKIAKMRLAEQLDIPYQVVHGVWNMRDSLKDKF